MAIDQNALATSLQAAIKAREDEQGAAKVALEAKQDESQAQFNDVWRAIAVFNTEGTNTHRGKVTFGFIENDGRIVVAPRRGPSVSMEMKLFGPELRITWPDAPVPVGYTPDQQGKAIEKLQSLVVTAFTRVE